MLKNIFLLYTILINISKVKNIKIFKLDREKKSIDIALNHK